MFPVYFPRIPEGSFDLWKALGVPAGPIDTHSLPPLDMESFGLITATNHRRRVARFTNRREYIVTDVTICGAPP